MRLYRLYNVESHKYGEPFALCDEHAPVLKDLVREYCFMRKIADRAVDPCSECERIEKEERVP